MSSKSVVVMTAGAELAIVGPAGEKQRLPLSPQGMTIGRHPECDVVLDNNQVSRRHARIFRDPFGRWIVEDLGSRHGVRVGDEAALRTTARAILPGEKIAIGPYLLTLVQDLSPRVEPGPGAFSSTSIMEESLPEEMVEGPAEQPLSRNRLQALNDFADHLSGLPSSRALYPAMCRVLSDSPGTAALVVRLPRAGRPLPASQPVLACHLGGAASEANAAAPVNIHLSRRVLESVRTNGHAVMASSSPASDMLSLTVQDEVRPRMVFCAPVAEFSESVDVVYLDVPAGPHTADLLDFVRAVARQVGLVQRALLLAEVKADHTMVDHQLSMAHDIQSRLVPTKLARVEGLDLAMCYRPALWVGGDYCDLWQLADGRLAFAVGDVSGKGLPAAMVMANLQAALRTTMAFCCDPSQAIRHVQGHLRRHLPDDMFVTLVLGVFNPADGRLEYVNAGHLLPLLFGPSGPAGPLGQPQNPPLGVLDASFETCVQTIGPQTGLLVYTDGITEAMSPAGELFGQARLEGLVPASGRPAVKNCSAAEVIKGITDAVSVFREDLPQQDDLTVLAMIRDG